MICANNPFIKFAVILLWCNRSLGQALDLRLYPTGDQVFRCVLSNNTANAIEISSPWLEGLNVIQVKYLDDIMRRPCYFMDCIAPIQDYGYFVATNACVIECMSVEDSTSFYLTGRYKTLCWQLNQFQSNSATMTLNYLNDDFRPCPGKVSTAIESFVVLHRWTEVRNDSDIGFLVLNGSNSAVTVEQPLFNDSRLVVHSPKIGYSNEVFAVDSVATNATVAARGTTEWRVPWTNLWNRIPAADRAQLTEAHEVDLYWKTPAFTSDALPLWLE